MIHPTTPRRCGLAGGVLVPLSLALAFFASCNDPQSPPPPSGDGSFRGLYDPAGGTLEFRIETPTGDLSALRLVASDLVFEPASSRLHAQVAIRNAGSETLPGPDAVRIGEIDPESVVPVNADPLPCLAILQRCTWEFVHHGTYGEDDVLSPGETSSPIEWIFNDPTGQSFSFRAALRPGEAVRSGVISGFVFADANGDGRRQMSEPGLAGAAVSLVHGESTNTTATGTAGKFEFQVAEAGLYEVVQETSGDCSPTTPSRRQVFIFTRPDGSLSGYSGLAFGCRTVDPNLESSVEGVVFEDSNRNGVREDDERGIPDVEVTAGGMHCMTPVIGVTHTDARGYYLLRQSDVHCALPWRVAHTPREGMCDTSPNPVDVGWDRRPDPRHYRVDFGVAQCDSLQSQGLLVVFVYWQGRGLSDRRLEIVELHRVQVTNEQGLASFALPAGTYTLHADVNTGGPPAGVNLSVTVRRGETTRVEVVDCLPCVSID